jgi:Rrf2 family protein
MRLELTLRGDYAVRAALAIAMLDGNGPVSTRRIAERMDIPIRYLGHVLGDLVRAGIIVATEGRNGGYRLAAPAADIDLLRVVDAVEERGDPARCVLRGGACSVDGRCAVHEACGASSAPRRSRISCAADSRHRDRPLAEREPGGRDLRTPLAGHSARAPDLLPRDTHIQTV